MCTKKEVLIFFAGFEAMHTIVHVLVYFYGLLPLKLPFFTLTPVLNVWAITINAVITAGLLVWASKLKK